MPKKAPPKKQAAKPAPKKAIAKSNRRTRKRGEQEQDEEPEEEQLSEEQGKAQKQSGSISEKHDEDEDDSEDDSEDEDNDDEEDESSQSPVKVDPANYAIKTMQFRERRGTKMTSLINRKKQEEDDPFWAEYGANYFGDLEAGDNDSEDYVQSSSGRDIFDSDFDQTESDHKSEQDDGKLKPQQIDEQAQKQRKKKLELVNRIKNAPAKEVKKTFKPQPEQLGNRYIHQMFTQQQLLGEAAHTEYLNWLSYRKLISIETVKKDYTKKKHHVEGQKIIYRDKITEKGERQVTYQLSGVEIPDVNTLSQIWGRKK